jgi:hypothetical protein
MINQKKGKAIALADGHKCDRCFVDTVLSVKGKQAKNQFPPLKQR